MIHGNLFWDHSGTLEPRDASQPKIYTPLDTIDQVSILDEDTVLLGKKTGKPHLVIKHAGDPLDRIRDIELPENLPYREVTFHSLDGNIMTETASGILLVYRGSRDIHWIVEGNIISYDSTGALYEKNGQFWSVDWSEPLTP